MSRPVSNGFVSRPWSSPSIDALRPLDMVSVFKCTRALALHAVRALWIWATTQGRALAADGASGVARQIGRNLTAQRIWNLPHLLVAAWMVVMLWGERWVFYRAVDRCDWKNWEDWPPGANPHHLILVADPQLIDPHSYPGRPWAFNKLTMMITDNYMRRSYNRIHSHLAPDTVFFLGDLFDGGREWKTPTGDFSDPPWEPHPKSEQKYLETWHKNYGQNYWLSEFARFARIFLDPWAVSPAVEKRPGYRARKIIASLPGNHDLGFSSSIKLAVRDRFETYFGPSNRVDVVGNHTIVSVDTVSLSAGSSDQARMPEAVQIYKPAEDFLNGVKVAKRRAVERELRQIYAGVVLDSAGESDAQPEATSSLQARVKRSSNAGYDAQPDFPTILLTHVPLYRPPGTPCGPLREHWPPMKPPNGQMTPVMPDHRNAITVARGFQYQNVLSEADSIKLVDKIGNIVHVFSGDDHDYCELNHNKSQGGVHEITVKSISMAMGVPTPGFLMVSLHNPVDANGKPLAGHGEGTATLQTHLCLLPKQPSTYAKYAGLIVISLALLVLRAFLVPVLRLPRFALDADEASGAILPTYQTKKSDDTDEYSLPAASGYSAPRSLGRTASTRDRNGSLGGGGSGIKPSSGGSSPTPSQTSSPPTKAPGRTGSGKRKAGWGWATHSSHSRRPKIEIRDDFYDVASRRNSYGAAAGGLWRAATMAPARSPAHLVWTEFWTTSWRCVWMAVGFWFYLNWRG